jgi:hypothetical protein
MSNTTGLHYWKCGACGCTVLLEVTEACTAKTKVQGFDSDGKLVFGQHVDVAVGQVIGYECAQCEAAVMDGPVRVRTRWQLVDLLQRAVI